MYIPNDDTQNDCISRLVVKTLNTQLNEPINQNSKYPQSCWANEEENVIIKLWRPGVINRPMSSHSLTFIVTLAVNVWGKLCQLLDGWKRIPRAAGFLIKYLVWFRNPSISAGLKPVLSYNENKQNPFTQFCNKFLIFFLMFLN